MVSETIKALRDGNQKVFGELFDAHYQPLCRYAFSILRDNQEAEDIVQKVFCKLWDKRAELEIHTSIKSFLYRIVHNESINFVRKQLNRTEINMNVQFYRLNYSDNVNEQMAVTDLEQAIEKAKNGLPPQCRKVFEMSRIEQKNYSEIALEMQISVNTVENHMSKALRLLRVALKEYLITVVFILNFTHQ
jgi:RNA polymerase sigma-70 factor (ECF subfamily)